MEVMVGMVVLNFLAQVNSTLPGYKAFMTITGKTEDGTMGEKISLCKKKFEGRPFEG